MTKSIFASIILVVSIAASCAPAPYYNGYSQPAYVGPGIGIGTVIAVVISWNRNKSVLWAIIHGLLGWLYVIYALIVRKK
jgi:hypothetical protein